MPSRVEIEAQLTGPGGPFEIVEEQVLGVRMPVFKQRLPSLRALLEQSRAHGDAEYIVYEDRRIRFAEHYRAVASVATALRERYRVSGRCWPPAPPRGAGVGRRRAARGGSATSTAM